MVALKGPAVATFIARPDRPVALVYGPDAGLVLERSAAIVAGFLGEPADPMARTVLDGDRLAAAPERLVEEALSVPMFGGRTALRVTATAKNLAPAVEPLLREAPRDTIVVLEAGDLKPSSPLRKAIEGAPEGVAIPCYADDAGAIDALIDEELASAGLTASADARDALRRLLGGDRLASRGELRKLAAYGLGGTRIELEDVAAVVGDASALALDTLVDAVGVGDAATADRELARSIAAGNAPAAMVSAMLRHFMQLADARHRIDRGATADAAIRGLRPPLFFKRHNSFRRQLGIWAPDALDRALELLRAAEAEIRRRPGLDEALLGRTFLTLANAARQPARRR